MKTKANATAVLTEAGLDWHSPVVDIDDALLAAGWSEDEREHAIERWLL